jgi:hypothetical protein
MGHEPDSDYYVSRMAEWLAGFDAQAAELRPFLARSCADAGAILEAARQRFADLIPRLPYIGGDENHLTRELVCSARCLALYQAMQEQGSTAAEVGKILYDAIPALVGDGGPPPQPRELVELMRRRRERAARSQRRQYPADWVYSFVPGDGEAFDYGYDFTECAAQKLYRAHGASEFLPYYCFLDFAASRASGLGLQRTMTLAEGQDKCDHRFKRDRETEQDWPPPWLRSGHASTLSVLPQTFAVCRLDPAAAIPASVLSCDFASVTRTADELSLVLPEEAVPGTWRAERGWRCLKVQGPLDFGLTGVLAALSVPLAESGISIFALSTYDTDYLLVRAVDLAKALRVLTARGHVLVE